MVRAKRICNLSLGVRHRHGLHWVRADLPRTQEVCTYSLREFSPQGERCERRQSKPDILLEFPYQSRVSKTFRDLSVTPCSFPPLEGNVKGVAQVFPSLGFCARSQSVARSALQLFSTLSLPAAKPYV